MVSYNSVGNNPPEPNNRKPPHHLLTAVKPPSKPPSKKPPSSATHPKVYNVKPIHFRELVQRLTGAASAETLAPPPVQRLQSAAPPPIQLQSHLNAWAQSSALPDQSTGKYQKNSPAAGGGFSDGFSIGDGMDLSLSPTSCSWFSFPLLSPGPLKSFGS